MRRFINNAKKVTNKLKNYESSYLIYNFFGFNLLPLRGCSRMLMNGICMCVAVVIVGYLVSLIPEDDWSLFFWLLLEYSIIVVHCAVREKPFNYLSAMSIDNILSFGKTEYLKLKKLHNILIIFFLVSKCFALATICWTIGPIGYSLEWLVKHYIFTAVDIYQIPRIIYFTSIYHRAQLISKAVSSSFSIEESVRPYANGKVKSTETLLKMYQGFLDEVEAVAPQLNPMLILSMCCSFLKILFFVYSLYLSLQNVNFSSDVLIMLLLDSMEMLFWLMPYMTGIINEMTSHCLDLLKISLMNQILYYEDRELCNELKTVVRHLDERQFKYIVWRSLEVDVSLLFSMLSLCVTLIIAIIQSKSSSVE